MAGTGATIFKWGCIGCLGLLGVLIVIVAAIFGVAWMGARSEVVEDRILSPEIPVVETEAALAPGAPAVGRVELDIHETELMIERGAPGQSVQVEASFDVKSYILEEEFRPGANEADPWTYVVRFRRSEDAGFAAGLRQLVGGSAPRVRVFLPAEIPLDLVMDAGQCGAQVLLGGLWLRTAEIRFEQGGVQLTVDQPLRQPLEKMVVRTSMGGSTLVGLGNASPRSLDIAFSMGGTSIDLRGEWMNDADITINGRMGGGAVVLPKDVIVEGAGRDRTGIETGPEPEVKPPTLRITVTGDTENIEFVD